MHYIAHLVKPIIIQTIVGSFEPLSCVKTRENIFNANHILEYSIVAWVGGSTV